VYSGKWGPGQWQGISKRVTPHAKPIDEAELNKHISDIDKSIALTRTLQKEVKNALAAIRASSS
jgi:hypothetical protein